VRVQLDASESEAALAILEKERRREAVSAGDWERLLRSPGYQRLVAREEAMGRPVTRADFESLLGSPELVGRAEALAATVEAWKKVDVASAAGRALAYLPAGTRLEATIYLLIKPKPNSFVFNQPTPGIFLAVDPAVSAGRLANTLAHELHHIGSSASCPPESLRADSKQLPPEEQSALKWLSAFGEGLAMLAAAGGPAAHPHAASPAADRARWDRDMARVGADLETLDRFFRDILERRITAEEADRRGFSYFGVQGPWYTVGYRMAATIERAFGRSELIRAFCETRGLPGTYSRAAGALRLPGPRWRVWSDAEPEAEPGPARGSLRGPRP
jgi:hypothetical protein